jgi:hypothetical protein
MDKKIIFGGAGAIAAAGLIIGGYLSTNPSNIETAPEKSAEERENSDDIYLEIIRSDKNLVFCHGEEKISGKMENKMLGTSGSWEYVSKEVNAFNKDSNKMQIIAREVSYEHEGKLVKIVDFGEGDVEISKKGKISEFYKNNGPTRLDYNAGIIYPSPDTKKDDWVSIASKMTGTVLGYTASETENEKGNAETFCSVFNFGDKTADEGVFTPGDFSFSKKCQDHSATPGEYYEVFFDYTCQEISSDDAVKLIEKYRLEEKIQESREEEFLNAESEAGRPSINEDGLDASANSFENLEKKEFLSNELKEAIGQGGNETPTAEDIRKQIEQMKQEIKADLRSEE